MEPSTEMNPTQKLASKLIKRMNLPQSQPNQAPIPPTAPPEDAPVLDEARVHGMHLLPHLPPNRYPKFPPHI